MRRDQPTNFEDGAPLLPKDGTQLVIDQNNPRVSWMLQVVLPNLGPERRYDLDA